MSQSAGEELGNPLEALQKKSCSQAEHKLKFSAPLFRHPGQSSSKLQALEFKHEYVTSERDINTVKCHDVTGVMLKGKG